mmetsp:Transcript_29963/g.78936  ORF Transcript_29963/g.78936 Transcript_29963/m.78936 type:complete len:115 (-) Transcript_29963:34-378(-)
MLHRPEISSEIFPAVVPNNVAFMQGWVFARANENPEARGVHINAIQFKICNINRQTDSRPKTRIRARAERIVCFGVKVRPFANRWTSADNSSSQPFGSRKRALSFDAAPAPHIS